MTKKNTICSSTILRRSFLKQSTSLAIGTGLCSPFSSGKSLALSTDLKTPLTSFLVAGDTHFLADKEEPDKMDPRSLEICGRLVASMNQLPGSVIPEPSGGGLVRKPDGLIHTGDIIDTGDKNGTVQERMQQTEWKAFVEEYGLNGGDGRLLYPVYEVFGNHDAPHGKGLVLEKIQARNRKRPHVMHVSSNGLHYSWDWGNAHFINLGIIVGTEKSVSRRRRYAALDSLEFLVSDLHSHVGKSGRPVIITHHIDISRYMGTCDTDKPADSQEWDSCDVQAYYRALNGYRIAAIFYGHTHVRDVFRWNGISKNATTGLNVFNADNASHFGGAAQAFFYVELFEEQIIVREFMTKDGWKSGAFSPYCWSHSFS